MEYCMAGLSNSKKEKQTNREVTFSKENSFLLLILLAILFIGTDIGFEYATDTYNTVNDLSNAIGWMIWGNARFVTAGIYWLWEKFGIPTNIVYVFSFVVGTFFFVCATYTIATEYGGGREKMCHHGFY